MIFEEKHKVGKILLQREAVIINDLPFSKHSDKGKAHRKMASHSVMEIERDEKNASEGEPDLEWLNRFKICLS